MNNTLYSTPSNTNDFVTAYLKVFAVFRSCETRAQFTVAERMALRLYDMFINDIRAYPNITKQIIDVSTEAYMRICGIVVRGNNEVD